MNLNKILTEEILEKYNITEWSYTEEARPKYFKQYLNWVKKEKHLPLNYLADHRMHLRESLTNYFPKFESAIVFLFSYQETNKLLKQFYNSNESNGLKISSYTLGFNGIDYHVELRNRLEALATLLKTYYADLEYVLSFDMHPVLERDLAQRSGLGWQGKNSMLITQKSGSFFIIASILINKKFEVMPFKIETDHCGQCTRCIDACPTGAIDLETRTIIARDCISTFTIEEFKLDAIPSENMNLDSGFIFGCDICQDVCPWNNRLIRQMKSTIKFNDKQKELIDFYLKPTALDLEKVLRLMSNGEYHKKFKHTSFERSGKKGMLKNLLFYNT